MKNALKILRYTKPHMFFIISAVICAFISVSFTLYIPVLVGNAIDVMLGKGRVDMAEVTSVCVKIGVCVGVIAVFQWLMTQSASVVSARTVRDMRGDVFRKFNTVPLSDIDSHPHGDLISRIINDVDAVGDGLSQVILQFLSGIVTIIGTLIFMLSINI